jgi:membrane-bound lytic murein transglycosylase A
MKKVVLLILSAALAGCATATRKAPLNAVCPPCPQAVPAVSTAPAAGGILSPAPGALPSFCDDGDMGALLKAALLDRAYFQGLTAPVPDYDFAGRKVTGKQLADSNEALIKIITSSPTAQDFDRLIKENFDVFQLAGRDSTGTVFFSSYYEPTMDASLHYSRKYKYPIYAKPDDLILVNLGDFNDKFKGEKISGRVKNGALVPYFTREDIDFLGALDKKGLELAWLKNRADLMDLHTEGSGRLRLPDGRIIKAKFAATNSLPFKGWLSAMVEAGALPRAGISPEKGEQYLKEHPGKARPILSMDKRYVFFKLEQPADPDEGPDGTYGLPLTGWRSVAVDNSLVPMGAIGFMRVNGPDVDADGNFLGHKEDSRFVFCQDTGGAIKGPGRVDFFAGAGKKAHTFAFKLWDPGQMYLLVLKEPKPQTAAGPLAQK